MALSIRAFPLVLCGLLLWGQPASAQETVTVSPERPSEDAALSFLEVVWDHLPVSGGVAIYLSCSRPDCGGQVPLWFSRAGWEAGLGEGGDYDPSPDLGLSAERLSTLRTLFPAPADLAGEIGRELSAAGQPVEMILLVYPALQSGEHLDLSWQLVDLSGGALRDPLGRLTVRLPPPPPPAPPPAGPKWHSRPIVWVGASLLAIGGATATTSSAALLRAEDSQGRAALSATATAGWLGVMIGGSMMIVPAQR